MSGEKNSNPKRLVIQNFHIECSELTLSQLLGAKGEWEIITSRSLVALCEPFL